MIGKLLKFVGFGCMMVGLGGMAEESQFAKSLAILIAGAIVLGIDSLREDVRNDKANRNSVIGSDASRCSFLPH